MFKYSQMKWLIFLSFLYYFIINAALCYNYENLRNGHNNLMWNKRLKFSLIRYVMDASLLGCIKECLVTTRCESINYGRLLQLCELNYQTGGASLLKNESGFVFGDINSWNEEIVGLPCSNVTCPENMSCKNTGLTYSCHISDCGQPFAPDTSITMTGEGIGIGYHRMYTQWCNVNEKSFMMSKASICETNGTWTNVTLNCHKEFCESNSDGYFYDDDYDMCIKVYNDTMTWPDARLMCINDGGDLMVVATEMKYHFILKICQPEVNFWLGATDVEKEGHFKWIDDTKLGKQPPSWTTGNFDGMAFNGNEADCVKHNCQKTTWMDSDCNALNGFICEKILIEPSK